MVFARPSFLSPAFTLSTVAIALAGSIAMAAAHAQQPVSSAPQIFRIPAGTLEVTLRRIARESGRGISADPALLADKRARALEGSFTPEQAAQRVLEGSDLTLVVTPGGDWSLRAAPAPASTGAAVSSAPGGNLATVTVTAASEPPAYMADRPTSIATKTDMLPRLTPFSVDQVSEEMIQERGDANIFTTLEGFAGLTTNSSNSDAGGGHSRAIQIRGFSNGQTLVNGIPSYGNSAGLIRSTDSLESVELLRGPAGLYYGAAEPGGVISYNYKRPKQTPAYVLRTDMDNKGSYGGMADMTGPLDAEGTLLYRLVGSYRHRKDDQDHVWAAPRSLMAALSYKPDRRFSTTLTYERSKATSVPEQENNFRIAAKGPLNGQYYPVSKEFFWGSLNDRVTRETDTLIWDATWSSSEALKIRGGLNYQDYAQSWQNTRVRNPQNGPNQWGEVSRYVSGRREEGRSYSGSLDISGTVRHGSWRNDWLAGFGFGHSESNASGRQVANQSVSGSGAFPVTPLNIYRPAYSDYLYGFRIWDDPLVPIATRNDRSFYLQDMLHLPNGRTRLMLGMGWSRYQSEPLTGAATKADKWSPRLAAMHDITDATTVYASYGESFVPQGSLSYLDTGGNYITAPVEGVQYEVGVKHDLFGGAAMLTGALFRVDKKNAATELDGLECAPGQPAVRTATPPLAGDQCYSLAGLTRAQGLELRLSGQITDGWTAQIGYSYTDAKYLETSTRANIGRTVEYTPKHNLSVWNKFRVHRSAELGEFHLGLGLRAWSKAHSAWTGNAARATTNWNPGYGLVDLAFFWDKPLAGGKKLKLSLNVSNAFNKQYYERRRFPPETMLYGDERRVSLAAQLAF
ncbi:TonB-dependent siderophore receptor [Acidovorax cavernicola]|uniref:TonB-dependent receptor n=1 Tax=Acidovorax cavernicola TaxID=1675792 RepID=A0A9X8D405_9BURK|nr:TonB-dependent receptor [Acidovorax cavernicola]RIX78641.1 TonB-dependent receptor [Acidovorax cavernicola]